MNRIARFPYTLSSARDLARAGLVAGDRLADLERVAERYAVAVTPAMAELIDADVPHDPIARQFIPDVAETRHLPDENPDPIGDKPMSPVPGLVHRYPDRVLLKLASICAVYCRFCFRREMLGPGQAAMLSDKEIGVALDYIAARPEVWEVVVSGGDPLVLAPRRLAAVGRRLAEIEHVKVMRWHSRVPVVAPERIDAAMISALKSSGGATWVAIHANHPRELTADARAALARLADAGIALISQSVLLRGINDDVATLGALMRAFVECRVKPYYLHQGDLAPGTSHLRTSVEEGQSVMRGLRGRFSGLCQPTYVLDLPGGHGKVPIGPHYLSHDSNGFVVEDADGRAHCYPPASNHDAPARAGAVQSGSAADPDAM